MDERTRSAMLDGEHETYELKENIMSTGMRVKVGGELQRCA